MGLKLDFLVFCPVVLTPPFQLSVSGDQALGMGVQPVLSVCHSHSHFGRFLMKFEGVHLSCLHPVWALQATI